MRSIHMQSLTTKCFCCADSATAVRAGWFSTRSCRSQAQLSIRSNSRRRTTMPVLQYVHLDVFTNQPFTGNQLAVFLDAEGIDEKRMQRIANEVALPETTFVFPPEVPGTDARVRIFTPSQELPMAGSPTVGTTFALAEAGGLRAG